MRLLIVDNFDSFTYNLANAFGQLGADVVVKRNDTPLEQVLALEPDAIVLSPGPGHPADSKLTLQVLKSEVVLPILGVCLGHQAIAEAYGGRVVRAVTPFHGKTSVVAHGESRLFEGVSNPFCAVRYHSLVIERGSLPQCLRATAETPSGEIMAVEHKDKPVFGVQFHPESILAQDGHALLKNFYEMARK